MASGTGVVAMKACMNLSTASNFSMIVGVNGTYELRGSGRIETGGKKGGLDNVRTTFRCCYFNV